MYVLKLNEQERQGLMELIDLGVRTAGLKVIGTAAHLAEKIMKAPKEEPPEPAPDA